jgi:hypothetical protein
LTVLVAALTSAAVALIIEYFAKPTLEARKDRILERHRAERAWRQVLAELLAASAMLPFEDMLGTVPEEATRRRTTLLELSRALERPPYELAMRRPDVSRLVAKTAGLLQGTLVAADQGAAADLRERDLRFKAACETSVAGLLDYLGLPRWALARRAAGLRQAREFLNAGDDAEGTDESSRQAGP